jgi:Ferredoxin-like domain in Api92-like protein
MPNWCNNNITISGDEGIIRTLTSVLKSLKSSDEKQSDNVFQSLIGLPQHMSDGDYKEKWYDTNIEWFGTKWDISYDEHAFTFTKDEITFHCETAWSPPIPFLQHLCEMYKVNAHLFYSEGGVGFSGESTFNWIDGELEAYDDECGYLEGMYKYSKEEFWSEVEYRSDCIIDEEQSLEDFLGEFEFVSDEDKVELTRIYNETINNNDEDDDTEGE